MNDLTFEDFERAVDRSGNRPAHAEQRAVITAGQQPMRVAAGAGTGKTTSMARRLAWLVASEQVSADQVLGLTFTTKAAAELQSTIRGILKNWHEGALGLPSDERVEPSVMTYNAFAARLIAEHGVRLGIEPHATVLVNGARHRLAYDVICRSSHSALASSGRSPMALTSFLLHLDDELANLAIEPAELIAHEDQALAALLALPTLSSVGKEMCTASEQRRALAELVMVFRSAKRANDVLDFADQTRLAAELVRTTPEVGELWRAQAAVVLLDEYQDTSIAQRQLLQGIFGQGHSITAVGDASQAIYGWRGASVANMRDFGRHFAAPGKPYGLNTSFRSGPAILAVANALSATIPGRSGDLTSGRPDLGSGHVTCGLFLTREEEHAWLVEHVRSMGEGAQRAPWGSVAVLASTGAELAALAARLDAAGIPTQLHGAAGLLSQPAVVDLRAMLEILNDPSANRSVVRALAGPRWQLGKRDLAALGRRAGQLVRGDGRGATSSVQQSLDKAVAGSDPAEAVSLLEAVLDPGDPDAYSAHAWQRLAAFGAMMEVLSGHTGEPVPELLGRVLTVTGLDVEILLSRESARHQSAIAAFVELAADITRSDATSLGGFLARLADAERFDVDLAMDEAPRPEAVQLMTIHKAKGLQFPHVIVPSLSVRAFPSGKGRPIWTTNPGEVPLVLREDRHEFEGMPVFPDLEHGPQPKDHAAYKAWFAQRELLEARRLAYVAATRAELSLTATGHWWGSTQSSKRGPTPFLIEIHETIRELPEGQRTIVQWEPDPGDGATNPLLDESVMSSRVVPWLPEESGQSPVQAAAELVRARIAARPSGSSVIAATAIVPTAQAETVARWDADLAFLLGEERERTSRRRVVQLPESVSASTLIRAQSDPAGLAAELARPMPRRPSAAARRGTAFHAWLEQRFGQASLIDIEDLPGAADAERIDASLEDLQRAFDLSAYADRIPVETEFPFGILIDGRVVHGRIDAVFRTDEHEAGLGDGRLFDVVDWKTGRGRGLDPFQLAIYRLAWARHVGLPQEAIGAAFLLVETGEVIRPDLPFLSSE